MAYSKGNAHYIAALASPDCSSVSAANLWVPLDATVYTDAEHRTYSIVLRAYCYWGYKTSLSMNFRDLYLGGVSKGTVLVSGSVSEVEPGREITNVTINGTFNNDGTPDIKTRTLSFSGYVNYYYDVGCNNLRRLNFSNSVSVTVGNITPIYTTPDTPTFDTRVATDSSLEGTVSTTSFGIGGGNRLYVQASKDSDFSNIAGNSNTLSTLSGNWKIVNLIPNTKYYLKATAANAGKAATSAAGEAVTLAGSSLSRIVADSATSISVSGVVVNGGGVYDPTTYVEYSTDGTTWEVAATTASKNVISEIIEDLDPSTEYYVRLRTVTTAGEFTSQYLKLTTPSSVVGSIISVEVDGSDAVATVTATSLNCENLTAYSYYRISGLDDAWEEGPVVQFMSGNEGTITLSGLAANYVEYDLYIRFVDCEDDHYETSPYHFSTIATEIENHTCESLTYMVQLICQSLKGIKEGNIDVFMNDDTKKWCEEEDDQIPTIASIVSRIQRYLHAIACVLCTMDGFYKFGDGGSAGQVFVGQTGWTDMDTVVTEGSSNLVTSDAVRTAIDAVIQKIWNYVGTVDLYGKTMAELESQTPGASATGIVGDHLYKFIGTQWVDQGALDLNNFDIYHVESGLYADKALYWFSDSWKILNNNVDTSEVEAVLAQLEAYSFLQTYDGEEYNIAIVPATATAQELALLVPTDVNRETIILMTEDQPNA